MVIRSEGNPGRQGGWRKIIQPLEDKALKDSSTDVPVMREKELDSVPIELLERTNQYEVKSNSAVVLVVHEPDKTGKNKLAFSGSVAKLVSQMPTSIGVASLCSGESYYPNIVRTLRVVEVQ